jgi:hypothetical protein
MPRLWRRHREAAAYELARAEAKLERVEREIAPQVHRDAAKARRFRRDNHLGPEMAQALEGR